jgi:hypothetical protein
MDKILAALHLDDPASLKRALTSALGTIVLLGVNPLLSSHPAWGIPPVSDANLGMVAGLLATFLLQSGANSVAAKLADAKSAGEAAAAQVDSVPKAAAVLAEQPK